jgi:hypothetical protein
MTIHASRRAADTGAHTRDALLRARLADAAQRDPHGLRRAVQRSAFRWLVRTVKAAAIRGYAHVCSAMVARKSGSAAPLAIR